MRLETTQLTVPTPAARRQSAVKSLIDYGTQGIVIDIECHLSNNLPNIVIVGFANRAIDESKERIRGAFASAAINLPRKRITINMAPADIPKDSSSFDLPIAAAIMQTAGDTYTAKQSIHRNFTKHEALMGELGLDGTVRPIRGVIGKILAGRRHGMTTFYIPTGNMTQAALVPHVKLVPISHIRQIAEHLYGGEPLAIVDTGDGSAPVVSAGQNTSEPELTLSDIVGQHQAKRALEIAAAGGHNLLLSGPPGTGKSMLARALPSIIPSMSNEEMLEVTHLHSLASREYDKIITVRPFRSPHHSASHIAVIGGGSSLKPGEISLANHGVILFDEIPEFSRQTLESLRQPLEDRRIVISRANGSLEYPANFIMVATANPCPCGYYGTQNRQHHCICTPIVVKNYRLKLSGPIMDRIDLYSEVHEVDHVRLLQAAQTDADVELQMIRRRIRSAQYVQHARYASSRLNATASNREIKLYARLTLQAKTLLDNAAHNLDLSARAYMRTIKVARTIADLDASDMTSELHVTEALQYRSR